MYLSFFENKPFYHELDFKYKYIHTYLDSLIQNRNISEDYDLNSVYNLQNIISKYDKVLFVIDETNSKIYESFSNYINLYHNMIIIKYEYNTKYLISNVKNIDIILDKKY